MGQNPNPEKTEVSNSGRFRVNLRCPFNGAETNLDLPGNMSGRALKERILNHPQLTKIFNISAEGGIGLMIKRTKVSIEDGQTLAQAGVQNNEAIIINKEAIAGQRPLAS